MKAREPYGVVWPQKQPELARLSYSWIGTQWLLFAMGIATMFPDPRKARRMVWVYAYPSWFGEDMIRDPVAMAKETEL